jgi:ketosteroid isomerase-like protein
VSNGAFVKGLYDAAGRGEPGVLIGALAADVKWYEAEGNPYAANSPYVGQSGVVGLLGAIASEIADFRIEVANVIDGGDTVAVEGRYKGTGMKTKKPMDAQFVHVWHLNGQTVVKFQQYTDTKQWVDVLGR